VVEEKQVLALDGEDQRLGVGRLTLQDARIEDRVEEEGGERRLGGHAGDAGDRHVGAPGAVEEVEVDVQRPAVTAHPQRDPPLHHVEVERLVTVVRAGQEDLGARQRRHEHLRLHPRHPHLGHLDHGARYASISGLSERSPT
jgi:hypothetical protein